MKSFTIKSFLAAMGVSFVVTWGFLSVVRSNSESTSVNSRGEELSETGVTQQFSNSGLSTIPSDAFSDDNRTELDVSNNNLRGTLTTDIVRLPNLQALNIANNSYTALPKEIGQLAELRIINASHNDLTSLPIEIGQLKELELLDVRNNPNMSPRDIGLIQAELPAATILFDGTL